MPNRLAEESSPYLLQHKDNPVEWLPWGEAAFEEAKREDKPVFLSVGYSSCHWCHVMAHESFEDDEIASLLNRGFVSVKVDREERPDVDDAYMTAVQLQSGRGGWPMSVFMTPDGAPFFAGTYFPKSDRGGHPGFATILRQLEAMWKSRRAEVESAAEEFRASLQEALKRPAPKAFRPLDWEFVEEAFGKFSADFDPTNGGFGRAPKFPPHSAIELCLKIAEVDHVRPQLRDRAKEMALLTLEKMCLGGLHDHVGGGFHRYSTDEVWLLPHFEKMLYDNALMLRILALAEPLADGPQVKCFRRAAKGIVRWLKEEMVSEDGLLCSAIDADSEGEEGKFYVWKVGEVRSLLGERAGPFLKAFGFEEEGNFLDEASRQRVGSNLPHMSSLVDLAFEEELDLLRKARSKRVPPMRDHKALVGWNGLAVSGLAVGGERDFAGQVLGRLIAAKNQEDRLAHQVSNGKASGDAYLEDVVALLWGAISLNGRVSESQLVWASPFLDQESGGYFATAPYHEQLFGRTKPVFDQPIPAANALMARVLIHSGRLDEARDVLESGLGWIERAPGSTEALLLAAVELLLAQDEIPSSPEAKLKPVEIVSVSLSPAVWPVGVDGWARGEVLLTIREGFHINTNDPPAKWLKPTELSFEGVEAVVEYPNGPGERYEGMVTIPVRARGGEEFGVTLRCQPCSETECRETAELRLAGRIERN